MKTRIAILVFFQSLLVFKLVFYHSLAKRPCQCSYYKGGQVSLYLVLISRSVLVLSQPSDVSDLVPLRLVSITLLSPMSPATSHIA